MKVKRQSAIVELINSRDIETQEELVALLREAGFPITQATISRDIRELKLSKVTTADGRQKYAQTSNIDKGQTQDMGKFSRLLKDAVVSVDVAGNLLVIKTNAGMAMAVAAAIDAMPLHDIVGSLAGDDTVFCAVRTQEAAERTLQTVKNSLK